jgi:hypothetical protein
LNSGSIENELCKNNNYSLQGLEDAINQALGGMTVVDMNSFSSQELDYYNSFLGKICTSNCSGLLLNNECEEKTDRYIPCSEVIFQRKNDRAIAQMEINNYALSICIPPPIDNESDDAIMGGLLRSVNLKVEIELPSYMVYSHFGYTNAQTRVAQFLSAAMQYALDVIPSLNSCDQLGTLRYQYRNAFMSFLNDNQNKTEFFGSSNGINF